MQAYFSRKMGGGFFFFTDPKCMEEGGGGGRGNFLSALKKFSARKSVKNYKEKSQEFTHPLLPSNSIHCRLLQILILSPLNRAMEPAASTHSTSAHL